MGSGLTRKRKADESTAVVFVHGILSDGDICWKNPNGATWPDLLVGEKDLEGLGVYVYTYNTNCFSGSYSLSDVVDDLKEKLKLGGLMTLSRLVFVCHSMGGIVVRKLLVERTVDFKNQNIGCGLFLVASPSLGSDYAKWFRLLARFLGHSQAKGSRLVTNNPWLGELDKEFMNLKEAGHLTMRGKELVEDKFVVLKRFLGRPVVEPFSGARYFGEPIKIPDSDHFSISKPEDKNAFQHGLLCQFIKEMARPGVLPDAATGTVGGEGSKTAAEPASEEAGPPGDTGYPRVLGRNARRRPTGAAAGTASRRVAFGMVPFFLFCAFLSAFFHLVWYPSVLVTVLVACGFVPIVVYLRFRRDSVDTQRYKKWDKLDPCSLIRRAGTRNRPPGRLEVAGRRAKILLNYPCVVHFYGSNRCVRGHIKSFTCWTAGVSHIYLPFLLRGPVSLGVEASKAHAYLSSVKELRVFGRSSCPSLSWPGVKYYLLDGGVRHRLPSDTCPLRCDGSHPSVKLPEVCRPGGKST